jgi:hypothetical protein
MPGCVECGVKPCRLSGARGATAPDVSSANLVAECEMSRDPKAPLCQFVSVILMIGMQIHPRAVSIDLALNMAIGAG